jgi:hypothetical protein
MNRGSIVGGVILILVGLFFLLLPLFPNVSANLDIEQQWPLIIVAIGGLFLLGALIGAPGLAIPGSIIAGLGLLMYYQNTNDAWETWAFAWTLIPGFVGVGTFLSQALDGNFRQGLRDGGRLIVISLIMFIIFGSIFGEFGSLSFAWAIGLIALGLWILARNLILDRKAEKEKSKEEQVSDS